MIESHKTKMENKPRRAIRWTRLLRFRAAGAADARALRSLRNLKMIPYSHILHIPKIHPFDGASRWTTFLGEFVKPIVDSRDFSYWFTYYGDFARFRPYTEDESVLSDIIDRAANLGFRHEIELNDKKENLTLEDDLGGGRFLGAERTDLKPLDRALKILNLVHAGAELFLHSLVRDGDYWREEICENPNNPFDSASRSYIHLLHNLCASDVEVVSYAQGQSNFLVSEPPFHRWPSLVAVYAL